MARLDRPHRNLSEKSSNSSWRSSFFEQVFEPRPTRARVHEWVHFNIKNLGDESDLENLDIDPTWQNFEEANNNSSNNIRPKNVRKKTEPFWVKNDGEKNAEKRSNKVVDCWPLVEEEDSNEIRTKVRSNEKEICSRKLSYESTGPHDERYYGEN